MCFLSTLKIKLSNSIFSQIDLNFFLHLHGFSLQSIAICLQFNLYYHLIAILSTGYSFLGH